jgi:hypothetical protein|tara:strand:+ start:293 stop:514 length:222 start_codon:yes stop_codon:yes gene_type:complete
MYGSYMELIKTNQGDSNMNKFTKVLVKAKDLEAGMSTEFGKLVKAIDEGEVMFLETRVMQFDVRKNQTVVVYA